MRRAIKTVMLMRQMEPATVFSLMPVEVLFIIFEML